MADFVLDASVAISWCFPGDPSEDTPYSRRILIRLATDNAVVPAVWAYEKANCIYVSYSRCGRITEQQIAEFLDTLKSLPIRSVQSDTWINVDLQSSARRWDLSAYDAAYLDLAARLQIPLATTDDTLRNAALAIGVTVLA